jgi:hypothetical protein
MQMSYVEIKYVTDWENTFEGLYNVKVFSVAIKHATCTSRLSLVGQILTWPRII